jgi:hypothetical protein
MKLTVGIFQGCRTERVHVNDDADYGPRCNFSQTAHTWRIWSGSLAEVNCGNCLRIMRADRLREVKQIERRQAGKDGIQVDAFEARL